jgi:hypothetical protein
MQNDELNNRKLLQTSIQTFHIYFYRLKTSARSDLNLK